MLALLRAVRRHLGLTLPLAALFGGAVLLGARGRVDGLTLGLIAGVGALTLLVPGIVERLNRAVLRGDWSPALEPGERVLYDGAADRYRIGWRGWMFLTDRRLVLYHAGGDPAWMALLADVAAARVGRYAGLFATDLVIELTDRSSARFRVEAPGEWVRRIDDVRRLSP